MKLSLVLGVCMTQRLLYGIPDLSEAMIEVPVGFATADHQPIHTWPGKPSFRVQDLLLYDGSAQDMLGRSTVVAGLIIDQQRNTPLAKATYPIIFQSYGATTGSLVYERAPIRNSPNSAQFVESCRKFPDLPSSLRFRDMDGIISVSYKLAVNLLRMIYIDILPNQLKLLVVAQWT